MIDNKLIDYLPPVLRSIDCFSVISSAVQPEITNAWTALEHIMDNQFIDTAHEDGISVWEKELGIIASESDSLEYRRQRIKAARAFDAIYTIRWASGQVRSLFSNTALDASTEDYYFRVSIPASENWNEICEILRDKIPQNMYIKPVLVFPLALNYRFKTAMHTRTIIKIKTKG